MSGACRVFYVRTLLDGGAEDLTVYVSCDGFIADVRLGREPHSGRYEPVDLASGKLITLPGFIDVHVHLRDFELSYKEDLRSGSQAAVSSGYVLVCDMPNTRPPVDNAEAIVQRARLAVRSSYTDYGIYCGIPRSRKAVDEVLKRRDLLAGFKIYPEDLEGKLDVVGYVLRGYDGLVVVHAELPEYVSRDLMHDLSTRYIDRPSWGELSVLRLLLTPDRRSRLHITHSAHPTTPYHCRSLGVTVDTTPAYFILSSDEASDCWRKVNPPLQDPVTRGLIFRNLVEGLYDAVVSDHAPHSSSEKALDWRVCPPGLALVEATSRVMLTLFTKGLISYGLLLKYMCWGPASILGVSRYYGHLRRGYRASFTVVDTGVEGVIQLRYSKARRSGLEGFRYRGEVVKTVVGGEVVYDSGDIVSRPSVLIIGDRMRYWGQRSA